MHRNQKRVLLQYEYTAGNSIDKFVRSLQGVKWSQTMRGWHVAYDKNYYNIFNKQENNNSTIQVKRNKIEIQKKLYAVIIIDKFNKKIELKLNNDTAILNKISEIKNGYRVKGFPKWYFEGTNKNYLSIKNILESNNYTYRKEIKKDIEQKQSNPIVKHYVQTMLMRNNSKKTIEVYTPIFKEFSNLHNS